jgi:hypothetical protein
MAMAQTPGRIVIYPYCWRHRKWTNRIDETPFVRESYFGFNSPAYFNEPYSPARSISAFLVSLMKVIMLAIASVLPRVAAPGEISQLSQLLASLTSRGRSENRPHHAASSDGGTRVRSVRTCACTVYQNRMHVHAFIKMATYYSLLCSRYIYD